MWTDEESVDAGHSIEPARWRDAFEGLLGRIAGRFARVEPRRRAARLVPGLLADLPRKNCWTIAERAGETTPDGMQHLLGRAKWDADQVRDDVCGYVVEHLHDDRAVLVVDETGDVKKGTGTQWVQLPERIRSKRYSRPWHHVPHDDEPKGPCRVDGQDGSAPAPSTATGQRVQGQSSTACLRMRCRRSAVSSTPATICGQATSARL